MSAVARVEASRATASKSTPQNKYTKSPIYQNKTTNQCEKPLLSWSLFMQQCRPAHSELTTMVHTAALRPLQSPNTCHAGEPNVSPISSRQATTKSSFSSITATIGNNCWCLEIRVIITGRVGQKTQRTQSKRNPNRIKRQDVDCSRSVHQPCPTAQTARNMMNDAKTIILKHIFVTPGERGEGAEAPYLHRGEYWLVHLPRTHHQPHKG